MAKKPSLRDIRKMQSVETEPIAETKIKASESSSQEATPTKEPGDKKTGTDKGKRKSPRLNITLSRHTHEALKAEIDAQIDKGLNASMSAFIDDLIREKLKLD